MFLCDNIFAFERRKFTYLFSRFDVSAPSDDSRSNANAGEETSSHPQRVQVSTHPRLVNANEITVQQPTVLQHAQPILTPTERLRRNDEVIVKALLDKHAILSQFLPGPNVSVSSPV